MSSIGLILLAAGASARMGSPKQLLLYQGRSLLAHAAETAVSSVCAPIVVVLGANAPALALEVRHLPVQIVVNAEWAEGMGGSVRAGALALQDQQQQGPTQASVLMLCDQPLVTAGTLNALVAAYCSTGSRIIASEYGGIQGVPALFSPTLLPELAQLTGQDGAKTLFARYSSEVLGLSFPEGAVDIDTPEDHRRLSLGRTSTV